jgi:ABC-type multidrug transport system fused ATPase/permease subunit
MKIVKKLLFLITPHDRSRAALLTVMILIMALLDMIGVASILPFITVLSNPNVIETNMIFKSMYQTSKSLGIENNQQFLFTLGILMFFVLVISISFKAITVFFQVRFIQICQYNLSKRLVQNYLSQSYSWFLGRHSADLGKSILSEVSEVIGNGLRPLMELLAKSMISIFLLALLIIINPKLSLTVGLSLGSAYLIIFYFIRSNLNRIGKERLKNNQLRFTVLSEAFGGVKEIKLGGLEKIYTERFSDPAYIYARTQASATLLGQLPRFFLEAVAFGGILLVILYLMKQSGSFNDTLPIVALYVFAGYRLIPAIQQIYVSFTQLTFIDPSLNKLYDEINNLNSFELNPSKEILSLKKDIVLKNIYYNYPNTSRTAISNLSINIPAKTIVGLVGSTGSGKTTVIDIILGLLEPQKGTLEVDGQIITKKNTRDWQRTIGYVPQQIYLSDDTVSANIAFGQNTKDINQEAVEKASKIANIHDFVIDELPKQYQTTIGERGIRLSGGQRQRIGIARALYHNPQILILDEATSALDNLTEKEVMDSVNNLNKNVTIIIIAHRLSTVRKCDKIYILKKGKLINEGTFEDLINCDENFRYSAKV